MADTLAVQDVNVSIQEQEAAIGDRVSGILAAYSGRQGELIPILQRVQEVFGYLPEEAMKQIAKYLNLPEITVYEVGTFYAQFKLVPTGRNIVRVCRGTACHVRGGARILREVEKQLGIKPGESTPDLEYSLETVACFGACALAPIVVINNRVNGRMTTQKVKRVLNDSGSAHESRS